jgi:shikimate dehydrogenase
MFRLLRFCPERPEERLFMSNGKVSVDDPRTLKGALRVGLIGCGIQASGSPRLHMEEGRRQNLDLTYELLDLDREPEGADAMERVLIGAGEAGFLGVNVTHPCKQRIIPYLDELSEAASTVGAVNAVVFSKGRRIGHNTDWFGFAEGFRRDLSDVRLNGVTQLGAGGAGSAVAYAVLTVGAKVLNVLDTDRKKAVQLSEALGQRFPGRINVISEVTDALAKSDGLINTTPVGMAKYPGLPLPEPLLRPSLWVAEIVYFPLETALLKAARACGCRTMDGVSMVVPQAAESFYLFTGIRPDVDRMLQSFRNSVRA